MAHRLRRRETLSLQRVQPNQETCEQEQSRIRCECAAETCFAGGVRVPSLAASEKKRRGSLQVDSHFRDGDHHPDFRDLCCFHGEEAVLA